MKANDDKNLEEFIEKLMKDQTPESPSFDFTSKVMAQVLAQVLAPQTSSITTYKPLISKPVFIATISTVIALVIYCIGYGNPSSNYSLPHFNIQVNPLLNLEEKVHFSNITTYTVVVTAVMLFIQISILKNHFDRRHLQ